LAISVGLDQPALVADLPTARALLDRALELDEAYEHGTLHNAFITLESVGGSHETAREHFNRAVELSEGQDAVPYVSLATSVAVGEENREEFQELLEAALAIDPDERPSIRLLNLVAQRRARSLLEHIDDLFFEPIEGDEFDDERENR